MNSPDLPPPSEHAGATRKNPFALQAAYGVAIVAIVAVLGFGAKSGGFLMFGIYVLPFIAVVCCCIREVRGFGCGLLLGLGLALLIIGAICAQALGNI